MDLAKQILMERLLFIDLHI